MPFPGKQLEKKASFCGTWQGWHSGEDGSHHGGRRTERLDSPASGFLSSLTVTACQPPVYGWHCPQHPSCTQTAVRFAHLLPSTSQCNHAVSANHRTAPVCTQLTTCERLDRTAPSGGSHDPTPAYGPPTPLTTHPCSYRHFPRQKWLIISLDGGGARL